MLRFDEDGQCWLADEDADLEGFKIIGAEDWKPGVVRLHAIKNDNPAEIRMIYGPLRLARPRNFLVFTPNGGVPIKLEVESWRLTDA